MAKCRHPITHITWSSGIAFTRHCLDCGAQLSLGRSNDRPAAVKIEIRAAELAESGARSHSGENHGMSAHGFDEEGMADNRPTDVRFSADFLAGYLCRELLTHGRREGRDATAWSWDPTRPVAGQYAHPIGAHDPAEDALRDPAVTAHNAEVIHRRHVAGATAARHWNRDLDAIEREHTPTAEQPATISIDSDGDGVAVQINGVSDAAPMFAPEEAEALADDLERGAAVARQAAKDRYSGPAVVVPLEVGVEPEFGVEVEVSTLPDGSHDRIDCPCDHAPGEVGPCGGCNCADGPDGQGELLAAIAAALPRPLTDEYPLVSWPPGTGCDPGEVP